jgi:hypothetical protein
MKRKKTLADFWAVIFLVAAGLNVLFRPPRTAGRYRLVVPSHRLGHHRSVLRYYRVEQVEA